MNRKLFWISLLLPILLIGVVYSSGSSIQVDVAFFIIFVFWIPAVTILRMRHLGFQTKEMLESMIPFKGFKYRKRIFFDD